MILIKNNWYLKKNNVTIYNIIHTHTHTHQYLHMVYKITRFLIKMLVELETRELDIHAFFYPR